MAVGRWAAVGGAVGAFSLAGYSAVTESMPEFRIYDGYRMLGGALIAVGLVAPWVWRWRRERSLGVVVVASLVGCWLPIIWAALRRHTPIMDRVRGSWYLTGGDVVATAIPVGVACLWFALHEAPSARGP